MTPDQQIARIAARQHSVFTLTQALACGFNPKTIEYRLKTERWTRPHRRVYRLSGARSTFEQRVMAAVLAAGEGAAASHRTAAVLFAIDRVATEMIEVTVPKGRRVRVPGVKVHHAILARSDVGKIHGIQVTKPLRTIIDLASCLPVDRCEDALHDLIRRQMVDPRELEERLAAMPRQGRGGLGELLRLVRERTVENVSGSGRENDVRRIVERAGLPELTWQFVILDEEGRFVARPDLSWPEKKIYIEYEGAWHLTPRQRDRDLDRVNRLTGLGWRPLIFTKEDFRRPTAHLVQRARRAYHALDEPNP